MDIKRPTREYKIVPVKGSTMKTKKISSSQDAYDYIKEFYFGDIEIYESFYLLLLNKANNTVGWNKLSQGGISGTVVDIVLLCNIVINTLSSSVILAHNHPSGNIIPSESDKRITKQIKEGLSIFNVNVLDHIILSGTENKHFSFADEGIL